MQNRVKSIFHKGVSAQMQGDLNAALVFYKQVLQLAPDHIPSLNNLGALYLQRGESLPALRHLNDALRFDPSNADTWNNLGILFVKSGDPARAARHYEKAIELKWDSETLSNLGAAYKDLGRLDQAEIMHRKAIALDASNANAYNNLALVYKETGRIQQAISFFQKALQINPEDEELFFNLAETMVEAGALSEAVSLAEKALSFFPDSITTIVGTARVYIECGEWEKADPLIKIAIQHPFSISDLNVLRHLLLFLNASSCSREDIARMHFLSGRLIQKKWKWVIKEDAFNFKGRFKHLSKLRIGYVSPDFNRHPVGWFFREIITSHDRKNFDIYCYSLSDREDDITWEIQSRADVFRRVKTIGDRQIARQIHDDRIQILVDLTGYTKGNRLDIFALRPAPVQITAIGYPHGTGLSTMDYRITDRAAEGPDAEVEYHEELIYVPGFFLPLPRFQFSDKNPVKEDLGFPKDGVIMVSFNAWHKLRPEVLRLWDRILYHVPNAFLVFSFKHADTLFAQNRIQAYFELAPERLLFLPLTETEEEHRARYQIADLALDPFPYCGTTTSWEAISMGVPVVTLKGKRHVERTTWSLLVSLGLGSLATEDERSYMKIAIELARNPEHLARVRQLICHSVQKTIGRGNTTYVRKLEKCFMKVWEKYLNHS